MTIYDYQSPNPVPLHFQASFSKHLPPLMRDSDDIFSETNYDSSPSDPSQLSMEEKEVKESSGKIQDQIFVEFSMLAAEESDDGLEQLINEQDIDGAYHYILVKAKEHFELNNFDVCTSYAYRAILSHPLELEGYMLYASALFESGEEKEALVWLDEAKPHFPKEPIIFEKYYWITKAISEDQGTHEALLNWLNVDKKNVDAWIEMIELERKESIEQALETTKKVISDLAQDSRLIHIKEELEASLLPETILVDTEDMVVSCSSDESPSVSICTRKTTPRQPMYPYLFNPLSQNGTPVEELDIQSVPREIWRKKLTSMADKAARKAVNMERLKKVKESNRRFLESNREKSLNFKRSLHFGAGRRSIHPRVRKICQFSTKNHEEAQDTRLSLPTTLESRPPVRLPQGFIDKASHIFTQFRSNGFESIEIANSFAKLSSPHDDLRRRLQWWCHVIPLQKRSKKDNLIEAIISGVNFTKKTEAEVLTFIKLLNRVDAITLPKLSMIARMNCLALNTSRAGNTSIHNFLWKDLQQEGNYPRDSFERILKSLEMQGYRIKIYTKNNGERVLTNTTGSKKSIRLLETQIDGHSHYDLLFPQFDSETWRGGLLVNDLLLRNGMSQEEIDSSSVSIGYGASTHEFDIIPILCNTSENNFYQAVVAGINTYQYQKQQVQEKGASILLTLRGVLDNNLIRNYPDIHQSLAKLHDFIGGIGNHLHELQLEDFQQKFRQMSFLLEKFNAFAGVIKNRQAIQVISEVHLQLRTFHQRLGNLQSNINHMKLEYERSYPASAVIARKNPEALLRSNLTSTNTYTWLWQELQQEGELKLHSKDNPYTSLPPAQIPDAIRRDLAENGYKVIIWTKGNQYSQSGRIEFGNKYLQTSDKPLKVIHLLQSRFRTQGSNEIMHYDIIVPKGGNSHSQSRKRLHEPSDGESIQSHNKRQPGGNTTSSSSTTQSRKRLHEPEPVDPYNKRQRLYPPVESQEKRPSDDERNMRRAEGRDRRRPTRGGLRLPSTSSHEGFSSHRDGRRQEKRR